MEDSAVLIGKMANPGKAPRTGKLRACAECRRLKLRCDRNFPCQACIRRGCSALCPDKCFTDEATPSSLKASSLRSREQIQSLKERVAALEEALSSTQPKHSLLVKRDSPFSTLLSAINTTVGDHPENLSVEETIDIFGTLSIGEDGSPVFHGATSMSEHFVRKSLSGSTDRLNLLTGEQPVLPSSLQLLNVLFPFAPHSVAANSDINEMLPYLPSATETLKILNLYWRHFSMGNASICRPQFMKQIFNYFYPNNTTKTYLERTDAHRLGVLFITLALGILTDLTKPMLSTGAEMYHQLARASLSLDPVCDHTTIHGLQCMVSIVWYLRTAPTRSSTGYSWALSGIIVKLASSIGIFRDSRRWLTDEDEIEQREVLCWELTSLEVWHSFTAGRPCSLDLTLVDCQRPSETAAASAGLPGFIPGYTDWKHRFYPIVNNILLVVQRPGPVKYGEILTLERQLRNCTMPEGLAVSVFSTPFEGLPDDATTKHLQRFTAFMIRETACCLLHRRFLVLTMQKDGDEPLRNPFWYSAFQAGYSASWIVKVHIAMYERYPVAVSRVPSFWSASFSAAVILGAIAARYWNRDYAKGTLRPFGRICALFQETADTSIQPANALEVLQRLQQRVRAQFPTPPDAVQSFDDLPLLGAQPSMAVPASDRKDADSSPSGTPFVPINVDPPLPSFASFPFPMPDGAIMSNSGFCPVSQAEQDALWSAPDPGLFHDRNGGSVPLPWPQEWQSPLPEAMGVNAPLESLLATPTPPDAEAGQWDQFLDRLGVWE